MVTPLYLSRRDLAVRWGISVKTVDRMRESGQIPWIYFSGRRGIRPVVRFALTDVEVFEAEARRN